MPSMKEDSRRLGGRSRWLGRRRPTPRGEFARGRASGIEASKARRRAQDFARNPMASVLTFPISDRKEPSRIAPA